MTTISYLFAQDWSVNIRVRRGPKSKILRGENAILSPGSLHQLVYRCLERRAIIEVFAMQLFHHIRYLRDSHCALLF